MAYDLNPSNFLKPLALWTDLGLRALDMTVSSSQKMGEGADRLARAGAGVELSDAAASTAAISDESVSAASSAMTLAADLQRSTFNVMTQSWVQWMSTLGSLVSVAADLAGRTMGRQALSLDAARKSTGPAAAAWGEMLGMSAGSRNSGNKQSDRRRGAHVQAMDHAYAAEPKRRKSSGAAKSKARRSRNT